MVAAAPTHRGDARVHPGGLTLVEAMISMLILGGLLVMVLNALGSTAKGRQVRAARSRGPALAAQLMAEVLQADYEEPDDTPTFGLEASEAPDSRAAYDDVDDYHGWSPSAPQEKDGTIVAGADGWRRSVVVQYVSPDDPATVVGSDQGLKRITLTATDARGGKTELTALRARSETYSSQIARETTLVSWVGVALQVGSRPEARVVSGTDVLNHVPTGE